MSTRRTVTALAAGAFALVLSSGIAAAHIDPDPKEAPAGSEQVVGFTVEHGCDGSPTVRLDMRLPDGVTGAEPEPLPGWESKIEADVVTFEGGPLPDDTEGTFRVRMTLPMRPGETIYFPFVQYCVVGEIRWIDIPQDGSGSNLDEPAPAMRLGQPLPTTTTLATTTTIARTSTTARSTTTTVTTTTTTVAPTTSATTTTPTTTAAPTTTAPDDESGSTGTVVVVVTLVVLATAATVVAVAVRARRRR